MTRATRPLRFLHRGQTVEIDRFQPMTTLLDWLRIEKRLTGTKEGCGEGDCGACTVALGRIKAGRLVYEPVNACILLLGQVDGCEVVTVEDLAEGSALHPVQDAMVRHHGSQCGFCTPGFVMSLFTLYQDGGAVTGGREAVLTRIAGNLCRCTGYRPIVDAALEACAAPAGDVFHAREAATAQALSALADDRDVLVGDEASFFAAPRSLDGLCALMTRHPDAVLVGGATDVGLWITKQLKTLPRLVHTGRVAELRQVVDAAEGLTIGAAVTYAEAEQALAAFDPDVAVWANRLGSVQVRATGTIGGNIANGSPIGDSPPLLIALGATLHLRRGAAERSLPLEDFFLAYGRQDRAADEIVTHVVVPRPGPDDHLRAFKIAKRNDQDISSVMGALKLSLDGRRIRAVRVAFGGLAGVPKRAATVEAALTGLDIDDRAACDAAISRLADDFQPMDDHRASARYRSLVAVNLLRKALAEIVSGRRDETRISHLRDAGHAA
ncbi:xanthine dehydrogenase small subunit [Phreatobacter stygius]|uniref:Xanthine dehydrogenase small subunit n=1 Tax=Phreatobacter stygius TaxID=1940610 RepID=A0A4D7BEM2_9HYPH|nr:xanthine dehydrogenase small subunit [Phreatobacter stygius]QCI68378.1 xanthine dehydrogenase small subunit [Phreatobacter stygius]